MQLPGSNFRLHNKRLLILFVMSMIALVIFQAACGSTPNTPTPVPAPTEPITGPAPTVEIVETTTREGVLRVAMQPMVNTDPAILSSDSEVLMINHVYDYLVDIDPQSNIQPRLATSWTTSADGLTYTFTLAENVTWHDGATFSAADVVYTFNRLKGEGLPTADLYTNITNIAANGDSEVVFTLGNPNPFFLYDLSDNHAVIIKDGSDGTGFVGTGPFIVTNYSPEDRITMVANENYFIAGQPKLAGLEIIFFNDETASVDALRGGQVDLTMRMSVDLFESLQSEASITTVSVPTNGFDVIRLRSDRAPGNDPRIMQALRLATDRQAIFDLVQKGYGALGNDTPIGPLYTTYHAADILPPARNVEAAKALLSEAGYPNGIDFVLHTPDTGGRPDLAAVLQAQWAEAGINVEISVEPESVYYGDDGWFVVDLGITGWGSRPYPQFYLDLMLKCEAAWNESHFCNEQFDQLATTAGTSMDEAARVQAYHDLQQLLIDSGPVIIPYYFAQFGAISNEFSGFELKAFAGRTDFRNISLNN